MALSPLDLDTAGAIGENAVSGSTRVRVLALAAVGPVATGYAAVAALFALTTALAPLAHFSTSGVLAAALPGWLAAHQVPLALGGPELGVLPLLPTIAVTFLVARAASGAADRLALSSLRGGARLLAAITATHAVTGGAIAALCPAGYVAVDPVLACCYPALLSALAAAVGVLHRPEAAAPLLARVDEVALSGLRGGAFAVVLLFATGGAVLTVGLVTSTGAARDMFTASGSDAGTGIGVLLLSLGYLPNAAVAATSFVAGPGFSLGSVVVSPLEFRGGPVPVLPLLAALPEHEAAWWPVLCVLPLGVGVLVGRHLRDVAEDPRARLRAVAVAAGSVAVAFVVLAGSAGGRLGAGALDPVSMRPVAVSLALALWVAVPAAITAWLGGPHPADPLPGLIPDEDSEEGSGFGEDAGEGSDEGSDGGADGSDGGEGEGPAAGSDGAADGAADGGEGSDGGAGEDIDGGAGDAGDDEARRGSGGDLGGDPGGDPGGGAGGDVDGEPGRGSNEGLGGGVDEGLRGGAGGGAGEDRDDEAGGGSGKGSSRGSGEDPGGGEGRSGGGVADG
jgi:hypothetical protein